MADIEVDPSQVHSIEVDPSQVQAVGEKSGFFGRLGENVSGLLNLGVGVATHPLDTAKAMLTPDPVVAKESADAFNRGDYGRAAGSLIEDIPLIGPQIRRTEQDVRKGDYGALAADTATALALGKLPGLARKIPGVNRALEVAGEAAHDPLGLQHAEPAARAATLERMGVPAEAPAATPAASPGRAAPIARMLIEKLAKKHPFIKGGVMAIDLAKAVGEILDEPKAPGPTSAEPEASKPTAAAFDLEKWKQAKLAQRAPAPPGQPTPEMTQQASVPFTPEEQALADHVMAGVEPQPPAAPPVGSDYVMPEPAPPPAGMPNVGDPRLATPPVLPPPTFPQPEAPPATEPPVIPPPSAPGGNPWADKHPTLAGPSVGTIELGRLRHAMATEEFEKPFHELSDANRQAIDDHLERKLAFERAKAKAASQPPAVNPGPTVNPPAPASTPAVRPAEPSAALGAFGVDEPLVLNRAKVKALAKDNGISEWDQLKMLRDQGIKIQDDPFMTGETQRNRRGKVTSPEPMKPEAKAPAGEAKTAETGVQSSSAMPDAKVLYHNIVQNKSVPFADEVADDIIANGFKRSKDGTVFLSDKPIDDGQGNFTGLQVEVPPGIDISKHSLGHLDAIADHGVGVYEIPHEIANGFKRKPATFGDKDLVRLGEPPTAAETEAAIRKQKMTELGELLNRKSEAPAADMTPERTLYHGTAAPDFKAFKGMTYLTDRPVEASLYANGLPGAGVRGGSPRVLHVKVGAGKTLNIAEAVENEIMDGGDIDKVIADKAKEAKAGGYRFLQFDHPGSKGGDIPVTVSLYPEDLSIQKSAKPSRSTKVAGGELGKLTKSEIDKLPAKQAVEYLRQTKR